MRIALVLDRFVPARGGLEGWADAFARWLLAQGHDVHAVATEFDDAAVPGGVIRHVVPRAGDRVARGAALGEAAAAAGADIVHDLGVGWRYDVLHPHGGSRRSARRAVLRAGPPLRRLRARLAALRAGPDEAVEARQYAPGAGRIVAVSAMVRTQLVRDYRVDPARITTVWNGVDGEAFSPAWRARLRDDTRRAAGLGDAPTFLVVAHNFELKGLETALRALGRLGRDGVPATLVVVGRGPAAPYARLAARLGVAGRVRFVGGVSDPRPWYAAADVLLHPTFYDACSLVVLEAWAMGLPAITTRANGVHALWPAAHAGWLVDDARDARAVGDAMRRALEPARRAAAGAAARAIALAQDRATSFTRLAALYDEIRPTRARTRRP